MIRADRKKWEIFLTDVRECLPGEFEDDCIDEGLAEKTGAFIFMAFMTGTTAENCARDLETKLGVDDGEL